MSAIRPLQFTMGPCSNEGFEINDEVAGVLYDIFQGLEEGQAELVFKNSYRKANRSSAGGYQGVGGNHAERLLNGLSCYAKLKEKYPDLRVTTDVHESDEIALILAAEEKLGAQVVDIVQIPAFLCRQHRFLENIVRMGRDVSIKKMQIMSGDDAGNIARNWKHYADMHGNTGSLSLMERGVAFGYNNLVVDPRGFRPMSSHIDEFAPGGRVIIDAGHSAQKPGGLGGSSGGNREDVWSIMRAALGTGYVDGVFTEIHPNPEDAPCDGPNMLYLDQVEEYVRQALLMYQTAQQIKQSPNFVV